MSDITPAPPGGSGGTPTGQQTSEPTLPRQPAAWERAEGEVAIEPATEAPPAKTARRSRLRNVLSALVSLAIIVGVFWYFLPQFTNISSVWAHIRSMSTTNIVLLGIAAAWNLCTYWFVMVATMPGLTYPQAMVVTESSTAVSNTMPAGGAIGIAMSFAMYGSWGFSKSRGTVSLLVSGIWNNFAKLGLPVLALALVALQGHPSGGRVVAGLVGIASLVGAVVVFTLMLRSQYGAYRFGQTAGQIASGVLRPLGRPPVRGWEIATTKFRARTILLLRARWHWITVATLVSHLSLFLVLLIALRSVGVSNNQVNWAEALAVFSFARLVTAIPLTPGGVGIVEVALITGLSAAGGPRAEVAAAVLVFRALTYVLPIPYGLATYIFWRQNKSWRRAPNAAPRTALVPETATLDLAEFEARSTAARAKSADRRPAVPSVRKWSDAVWLVGAVVLLVLSALPVHRHSVAGWEHHVFNLVNNSVTIPFVIVWPIMQLGNIVAVPVAAAASAIFRRFQLAIGILIGGGAAYYLAKVVKDLVVRGRPFELLSGVHIHGAAATGRGYPSGHASVVAMLAVVAWPYLARRGRWVVCGLAVLVCLARMYVGAHLPLDVVAGAAIGVAVGAAVRLLLGRPA
jgi:uncharacterized membrane protein YbhN (UPF0104 family)